MKHKSVPPPQQVDGLEDKPPSEAGQREEAPGDAAAEQLLDLPGPASPDAGPGQLDSGSVLLGPSPASPDAGPGQLDLAQRDELEAAEKRRHEQLTDAGRPGQPRPGQARPARYGDSDGDGDDVTNQVDLYGEPEAAAEEALGRNRAMQEVEVGDEQGGQAEEEEEEALFMESVIEALRDRPDLLQQFLQGRLDDNIPIETRVPAREDDADRAAAIRAEYLAATGGGGEAHWEHQRDAPYMRAGLLAREQLLPPVQVDGIRELDAELLSGVAAAAAARDQQEQELEQEQEQEREREQERELEQEQEQELAHQRYADLERYQQYRGDKEARVVKKAYNGGLMEHKRERSSSEEDEVSEEGEESSKSDSSKDSSSSSEESKSEDSSESQEHQEHRERQQQEEQAEEQEQEEQREQEEEVEQEEQEQSEKQHLANRKRVAMPKHLMM